LPIEIDGSKLSFYRNLFLSQYCASKCLVCIRPKEVVIIIGHFSILLRWVVSFEAILDLVKFGLSLEPNREIKYYG